MSRPPTPRPALAGLAPAIAATAALVLAANAQARSPVAIEGVEDERLARALRAQLPDRDAPQSRFAALRLAEEAQRLLGRYFRSEGYYAAALEALADADPPTARLTVDPGPQFHFAAPSLEFEDGPPTAAARDAAQAALATHVAPGSPARAADVLAAEAAALAAIAESGYPDAEIRPRQAIVDHAAQTLNLTLRLRPGPPTRLGALRFADDVPLRAETIEALQGWAPGDAYANDPLAQLRGDLAASGAFSRVRTELAEAADDQGLRDVLVSLEPAPPRSISVGAAYSTIEGVGVDVGWTRRNARSRLDTLTLSARAAELEQGLSAQLRLPHTGQRGRTRSYEVALSREDTDAFRRAGLSVSTALAEPERNRLARSYGLSASGDVFDQASGVENAITLSGFGALSTDRRDASLDPTRGFRLEGRLEPGFATGDASVAFARATAEARGYLSPGDDDRVTLAARTRVGWVAALWGSDEDLPLDRRFFAGGGGSVRGFAFNAIFPEARRDAVDQAPGGQGLLELSGEARWRVTRRWGVAAFADAGSAFDELDDAGALRWGAGLGLRYDLDFAPLRFDVAAPLNRRDGDAAVVVYLSLGQAF